MKNVTVIGGGTGLATLLRGLKEYPLNISAIVTMTDDGASTGRLRRETGILPPGDIRKCLAALSENETEILNLFNYRFKKGFGISGHSLGNLFLTALAEETGSFEKAVEKASDILNIKGRVIPATLEDVHLGAHFEDGMKVVGEHKITQYGYGTKIAEMFLSKEVSSNKKAIQAIKEAQVIAVGPGSLFTSIIPNFLHLEILSEFNKSKALKIYICNVSTERGETEKFSCSDHLEALKRHGVEFDLVLANSRMFREGSGDGFVDPVKVDITKNIVTAPLSSRDNPLYHESTKLAKVFFGIIEKEN